MRLDSLRRTTDRLLADKRAADAVLAAEKDRLADALETAEAAKEAQRLIQEVAKQVQEEAHAQIGGLVTRALNAVFGESAYTFEIKFERKRGKTEARLVFVRDGQEVEPLGGAGGGCIQVASFALQVSCLILQIPPVRRLLVADEKFSMVSKEYRPRLCALIEALAEELDFQFIFTTHLTDMHLGTVIQL
jgi:hypothetical protein